MKPDPNPAYRRFRDYRPPSTVDRIVAFSAVFIIFAALLLAARAAFALPFAMRLAFCGQSTSSSSSLANLAYPENYVQDGLVCMYDGKWNAGWGRHDSTATIWRNIGSGGSQYDAKISSQKSSVSPNWGDNYAQFKAAAKCFYIDYRKFLPTVIPTNWTIECVVKDDEGRYHDELLGPIGLNSLDKDNDGYYYTGLALGQYRSNALYFGVYYSDSPNLYCRIVTNSVSETDYATVVYSLSCAGEATDSDEIRRNLSFYRNGKNWRETIYNAGGSIVSAYDDKTKGLPLNHPGYLCIGSSRSVGYTVGYNYIGRIYVVRIYNRTLTDEEVAHNYVVDAARFGLPYADPTASR